MERYRICLLPQVQVDEVQFILTLQGNEALTTSLWESNDVSLNSRQTSRPFANVPPLALTSRPGPHHFSQRTLTKHLPNSFSCFHLPTLGPHIRSCSLPTEKATSLQKFLIHIHNLKGTMWQIFKIMGLHSWTENTNKTKGALLRPSIFYCPLSLTPSFRKKSVNIF